MKKLLLSLSMAFISITGFSQDEVVNIPDANFLNALIDEGVDTNEDGKIQKSEAEGVTVLHVSVKSISTLTGIEKFINLTDLSCRWNLLTSLNVSNNTELKKLDCPYNQLTILDISNNILLESLSCGSNKLISLDVSDNTLLKKNYRVKQTN